MEFEAVEQPVKECVEAADVKEATVEVAATEDAPVAQASVEAVKAEAVQAATGAEKGAVKGAEVVEKKAERNEVVKPEKAAQGAVELAKKGEAVLDLNKPYEEMNVAELQEVILGKMRRNGTPMTEQIIKSVRDNEHLGSLVSWAKSF